MTCQSKYWFSLFLILSIFSCNSFEEESPTWSQIDLPTTLDLTSISICSNGSFHVVGGDLWSRGIYCFSPFGESWTVDSVLNKQLLVMDQDEANNLYTTGMDGFRLTKDCDDPWKVDQPIKWGIMRDLEMNEDGTGIMVGGEALILGHLVLLLGNGDFEIQDWDRELSSITQLESDAYILTGFGFISKSIDGGKTWIQNEIGGDFFVDCFFPSEQVGFVIGRNGTILKTIDEGEQWQKLRNAYDPTVADLPFNAVYFMDEERGFICGDNGLVLRTEDGGSSWTRLLGLPEVDYLDLIAKDDGLLYVVGKEGTIVEVVVE